MSTAPTKKQAIVNDNSHSSSIDTKEKFNEEELETREEINILSQYSEEEVMHMGRTYAFKHSLNEELFAKAAALARSPGAYDSMSFLSEADRDALRKEANNRWHIPKRMYALAAMSSMAAAVQGMDESVINGANIFYPVALGIGSGSSRDSWLLGLVTSAGGLCMAFIGCWLTQPMNNKFGRKWTIFICCIISALTCFWQGLCNTWWHLFIARFCLGFGVGPKATTVPIYVAECAPTRIRGGLVMLWQLFTAFGIALGLAVCLMFFSVPAHGIGHGGLAWRLMLGSAGFPALIVCCQLPFCPESPRWLLGKERHAEAFKSMKSLRVDEISAARDMFYQYVLLQEEESYTSVPIMRKVKEMFTVTRNRNAAIASCIVMFMQQFCGANVFAFYGSTILIEAGFSIVQALGAGFGSSFTLVFSLISMYKIDTFGRRNLLLTTYPFMCILLLIAGFAFWIPETMPNTRAGVVFSANVLFSIFFSLGQGPVPFTYSAEAYPLYIRELGMSLATAVCMFFSCVLSITWPSMLNAFKAQGAFGWYAAWNMIGWFMVLWFVPETKGLSLEELDEVFSIPMMEHASYQNRNMWNMVRRKIFRQNIPKLEPLTVKHRMVITNAVWDDKPETSHVEMVE